MTTEPCTVSEDDSLEKVVELMERRHVKRLPVMRDGGWSASSAAPI